LTVSFCFDSSKAFNDTRRRALQVKEMDEFAECTCVTDCPYLPTPLYSPHWHPEDGLGLQTLALLCPTIPLPAAHPIAFSESNGSRGWELR
jgi:hypothetical protein